MLAQDLFNDVVQHLRGQRERCMHDGLCAYVNERGLRCAVGALIPDNHSGLMFRGDVYKLVNQYPDLERQWGADNLPLLAALQRVHDRGVHGDFEDGIYEVAKTFRLAVPA